MTYSIEKVTTLIGARRFGERDTQISFILSDSRSLCFPEETLFFALRSGRNDGHRYINELYARGVQNFVVSTLPRPQNTTLMRSSAASEVDKRQPRPSPASGRGGGFQTAQKQPESPKRPSEKQHETPPNHERKPPP